MSVNSELTSCYQDSIDPMSALDAAELDKQLVKATEAAIGASFSIIDPPAVPRPRQRLQRKLRGPEDSNANNVDDNGTQRQEQQAVVAAAAAEDAPLESAEDSECRDRSQARRKPKQKAGLRQRFGQLLAYVTGSSRFGDQAQLPQAEMSNRHNNRSASAKRETTTTSHGCRGGRASAQDRQHRYGNDLLVINTSNTTSQPEEAACDDGEGGRQGSQLAQQEQQQEPATEARKSLPKQQQQQPPPPPPPQQQQQPQQRRDTNIACDSESQASPQQQQQQLEEEAAAAKSCFTTPFHRHVQESIFRECRVVPVDTLYKKVALMPGRERLFLSAPRNPRTVGSRLLYDIAYENFRHHSDCNRDFTRTGLKKICPGYCRPSQFRYVY